MDKKFYVPYKVARLLQDKGYDKECISYYCENDTEVLYSFCGERNSTWEERCVSAPTKAEAIDWLESKGILVEAFYTSHHWFFSIIDFNVKQKIFADEYYSTRLEAEEAAIIKALELL